MKTKDWWLLILIISIGITGLLISGYSPEKISFNNFITGYALSDIQISACEAAHEKGTCNRLSDLPLVTAEQCCSNLGKCCTTQTCSQAGGTCKTELCSKYQNCNTISGTCTSGYCCTGGCCEAGLELCPDGSCKISCPCESGTTRICGKDIGICKKGTQVCVNGKWGTCQNAINPQQEKCDDNLDNDCNGLTNENCGCTEDETKECGSDLGICKKGMQLCSQGFFSSICYNETKGTAEICTNNLDDDCDGYADSQDSECQLIITSHCENNQRDEDEEEIDCGGKDCTPCLSWPSACDYGLIEKTCLCEGTERSTGYCCNGKYSITPCIEISKDSDGDELFDDKELQIGTNPYNKDTDGDGLLDGDANEKAPLCNNDDICDSSKSYPETAENCEDCAQKKIMDGQESGLGKRLGLIDKKALKQIIIVLSAIILIAFGILYYIIGKLKESKEEREKPETQTFLARTFQTSVNAKNLYAQAKLRIFIRNALAKGYSPAKIKQNALKAGWEEEDIDKAFSKKTGYKFV